MKLKILVLAIGFVTITLSAFAQKKDTVVNFDQLKAPASPAFNMLGISPTDIERPTNPTDFAFSLANASSGFSTIPKSYALEIAPFWAFGGKSSFKQFIDESNVGRNILQTAVFSLATTTAISAKDSSQFRQLAFAVKFSIFRGYVGPEFKKWTDTVTKYVTEYAKAQDSLMVREIEAADKPVIDGLKAIVKQFKDTDPNKAETARQQILAIRTTELARASALRKKADTTNHKPIVAKLDELAKQTSFKRYGFKMDFALGTVLDYPDSTFDKSYVSKFATWLTAGWDWENDNSLLFLFRYSANNNRFYRNDLNAVVNDINIQNLDMGVRFYRDVSDKLTISAEYINRLPYFNAAIYDASSVTKPTRTDKYDFSLNYKVAKNQNLSFTYGKNFDNIYHKTGNLIAAINYMIGLGSSRGVNN